MISFHYKHYYHISILLITTSLFFSSVFPSHFLVRAQRININNDNSNSNSNSNLNPFYMGVLAIGVIVVLTILYYITHLCYHHCSDQPSLDSVPRAGLSPVILNEFPVFTYPNVADHIGPILGPLECAVCLSPYKEEQFLRLIPKCDHLFHLHCVDRWLVAHTTCPICRADLVAALSQSSRVESTCIEELENGLGAGLIHHVQNDDTVDMRQEIQGRQVREIWRSNSTGHVANNHRAEEDAERFRLTS